MKTGKRRDLSFSQTHHELEGRDEEACGLLREDLHECAAPCRDAFHDDVHACREAAMSCVEGVCGVEIKPRGRPEWRFGGNRIAEP